MPTDAHCSHAPVVAALKLDKFLALDAAQAFLAVPNDGVSLHPATWTRIADPQVFRDPGNRLDSERPSSKPSCRTPTASLQT